MQELPASVRRPLDAFPVFRSADVDEARGVVTQVYGENRLLLGPGLKALRAYANHCQLDEVGISYGHFGAAVEFDFPVFTAGYSMPMAVAGGGRGKSRGRAIDISQQQTFIASPGAAFNLLQSTAFQTISVQLGAAGMKRKLAGLLGAMPKEEIVFEPLLDLRRPENAMWQRLVWFLIGELDDHGRPPQAALAEIEQALLVTFLKANPHNYSHLLAAQIRGAAPWQVRLAESYIEAHWDQPITIEALALVANSSARSIFHSFKQSRGYSPMVFVKQTRLRHAQQMLAATEHDTSVADVAFACGFSNLGNFAKDYFTQFGERPSQTLSAARGVIWAKSGFTTGSRGR